MIALWAASWSQPPLDHVAVPASHVEGAVPAHAGEFPRAGADGPGQDIGAVSPFAVALFHFCDSRFFPFR